MVKMVWQWTWGSPSLRYGSWAAARKVLISTGRSPLCIHLKNIQWWEVQPPQDARAGTTKMIHSASLAQDNGIKGFYKGKMTVNQICGERKKIHNTILRSSPLTLPTSQVSWSQSRLFHSSCVMSFCSETRLNDLLKLGDSYLKYLNDDIKKELFIATQELKEMCEYHFDGKGKAFRAMIIFLMAQACNAHYNNSREMHPAQRAVAVSAEMLRNATLIHDDIIDNTDSRRGKKTVHQKWDKRRAVLAGDYIISAAYLTLARIGNTTVISIFAQIFEDLALGEFLQLGTKENRKKRFVHYLDKTFRKTGSIIANSCKAVSVLACPDLKVHEIAYQYGRNIGIALQLMDDVLDFTLCLDQLGKPRGDDLKTGLATGPVLFASQQFPELNAMIMRRFSLPGDVEQAWQYVHQSDGIHQTISLAQRYCNDALQEISKLQPSQDRDALIHITETVLTYHQIMPLASNVDMKTAQLPEQQPTNMDF